MGILAMQILLVISISGYINKNCVVSIIYLWEIVSWLYIRSEYSLYTVAGCTIYTIASG